MAPSACRGLTKLSTEGTSSSPCSIEFLPNEPRAFNVLYLGSSALPLEGRFLVRLARRRGAAFVWNQNRVAYRGWYGDGWELVNRPRAKLMHEADYVFFQSEFSVEYRQSAFMVDGRVRCAFLYNPVDTNRFTPALESPRRPLTLLLGGNQYQRYRLTTALETLSLVRRERADARLLVTVGALSFDGAETDVVDALIRTQGLRDAVEFLGPYTQAQAPALMRLGRHPSPYEVQRPVPVGRARSHGFRSSGGLLGKRRGT